MAEQEDFEDQNNFDEDDNQEPSFVDILAEYFCPDVSGDVDDMDFKDDETYRNSPEYEAKYGQFDRMMQLFFTASGWDIEVSEVCITAYLQYTKPENIKKKEICYYLFRSHLTRRPEFNPNPKLMLDDDQVKLLDELDEMYDFVDLSNDAMMIDMAIDAEEDISFIEHDNETLELMRIERLALVTDDIPFYKDEQKLNRRTQVFATSALDMLTELDDSENKAVYDRKWELVDELLDIYSIQLALKEQKKQMRKTHKQQAGSQIDLQPDTDQAKGQNNTPAPQ